MDDIRALRESVVRRPDPSGPGRRIALTAATDGWLAQAFAEAVQGAPGYCLLAVGSHGRRELAPGSDLDLALLHPGDEAEAARIAERLWYPIWDAGIALDHSVRTVAQARRAASSDLRVVLGLMDGRPIAGDAAVGESLVQSVLADWRAMASGRLPDLWAMVEERRRRAGDLACLVEPDLKESYGGLRDASVLRAVTASWLTDAPHDRWPSAVQALLDVRDALHRVTGRRSDVLRQQEQAAVAELLGLPDADALLRKVFEASRSIAYASEVTWYRVHRLRRLPASRVRRALTRRGHDRVPLAEGVVVQSGEVVLAMDADPARDPALGLRAAAAAAQAGLPLAPHTVSRIARESAPLPSPWPRSAREAFVSLLGAGQSMIGIWEGLDQAGVIETWVPGWEVIRSAPQRDPMHRYTVDRHLVQTAVEASALSRSVDRPDLLLVGALLHDIGKARGGRHAEQGADLARDLATRMGFDDEDVRDIVALVRWHLLLADTAIRRDLEDPSTVAEVVDRIPSARLLALMHALSKADALATGDGVWNDWRRHLIDDLVRRCRDRLAGEAPVEPSALTEDQRTLLHCGGVWALLEEGSDDIRVTVAAPDRIGLLATVAGLLSMHRLQVRAARVITEGDRALQEWTVRPMFGHAPSAEVFADDVRRALDGTLDVRQRLAERDAGYRPVSGSVPAPMVMVGSGDASRATALEVRAHDAPGLLHRIAAAVSAAGASIRAAKVSTLGSEVIDVFFLTDRHGAPLTPVHADAVRVTVQAALEQSVP